MFCFCAQPLQIKSVVAPEHVKGYIYVEAYKQTHVKAAIEGVGNLRMGFWNQQMVPIKEMTDVLKVVKEVTNLKPKSWVRLKRGLYKDDIAQVSSWPYRWCIWKGVPVVVTILCFGSQGIMIRFVTHKAHAYVSDKTLISVFIIYLFQVDYVEPSQNTISLKMIPRIDLDRIKARMSMVGFSIFTKKVKQPNIS